LVIFLILFVAYNLYFQNIASSIIASQSNAILLAFPKLYYLICFSTCNPKLEASKVNANSSISTHFGNCWQLHFLGWLFKILSQCCCIQWVVNKLKNRIRPINSESIQTIFNVVLGKLHISITHPLSISSFFISILIPNSVCFHRFADRLINAIKSDHANTTKMFSSVNRHHFFVLGVFYSLWFWNILLVAPSSISANAWLNTFFLKHLLWMKDCPLFTCNFITSSINTIPFLRPLLLIVCCCNKRRTKCFQHLPKTCFCHTVAIGNTKRKHYNNFAMCLAKCLSQSPVSPTNKNMWFSISISSSVTAWSKSFIVIYIQGNRQMTFYGLHSCPII